MYESKSRFPLPLPHTFDSMKPDFIVAGQDSGILTFADQLSPAQANFNAWINYEAHTYIGNQGNTDPLDPAYLMYLKEAGLTPHTIGKICNMSASDSHDKFYLTATQKPIETATPAQQLKLHYHVKPAIPMDPMKFADKLIHLGVHEGLVDRIVTRTSCGRLFSVQCLVVNNNNITGIVDRPQYASHSIPTLNAVFALSPARDHK